LLPVAVRGEVVGALHFASSHPDRSFETSDFFPGEAIGGLLGVVIDRIQRDERTTRERDRARSALELAGVAVVVADAAAPELEPTAAARRLLSEIVDGVERMLELLARRPGRGSQRSRGDGAGCSGWSETR